MEWEQISPEIDVRQGDLLIERDASTGGIKSALLVMTADCDISKGKFGSHLAALRITPLTDYVTSNWAESKLNKKIFDQSSQLHQAIKKHHGLLVKGPSGLTPDALVGWIKQESAVEICAALELGEKDTKKISKSISNFSAAILHTRDGETPLERLARINSVYNDSDIGVELNKLVGQAQNEEFPDDIFILSGIPDVSAQGGAVMLRELVGVPLDTIKYRLSEVTAESNMLRTYRLIPHIKYAISQSFGSLYSRIGLSREYEAHKKATIQNLVNHKWI